MPFAASVRGTKAHAGSQERIFDEGETLIGCGGLESLPGHLPQRLLAFEDHLKVHTPSSPGHDGAVDSIRYKEIDRPEVRPGWLFDELLIVGQDGKSLLVKNLYKLSARHAKEFIEERVSRVAGADRSRQETPPVSSAPDDARELPNPNADAEAQQHAHSVSVMAKRLSETLGVFTPITAVIIYPLGFLALCLQIYRDPSFPSSDLYMAWYATSVIPHMVIFSTAVHVLFLSLISSYVGLCLSTVFLALMRHLLKGQQSVLGRQQWLWRLFIGVGLPLAILYMQPAILRLDIHSEWPERDYLFISLALLLSLGVGILVGFLRIVCQGQQLWRGLGIAYGGAVVAALCFAFVEYPALPLAEFTPRSEGESIYTPRGRSPEEVFQLLGNSGGRWYGYNTVSGIVSISESEVETILLFDAELDRNKFDERKANNLVPTGARRSIAISGNSGSSSAAQEVTDFFMFVDDKCVETTGISAEKDSGAEAVVSCSYGYIDADFVKWASSDKMDEFYSLLNRQNESANPSIWSYSDRPDKIGRRLEYTDVNGDPIIFWTHEDKEGYAVSGMAVYRNGSKKNALYDWWASLGRLTETAVE